MRNYLKRSWLYGLLLGGQAMAFAQQPVDLTTALETATNNYPSIRAQAAAVQVASQDLHAATNAYVPRLLLQHQYTYATSNSVEGSYFPNAGTISPSGGIREENIDDATFGSFTSAILEWDVFSFGKIAANIKAAKSGVVSNESAYENEVFQHQVRVIDAYLMLLIAQKLYHIQEHNVKRAQEFSNAVAAGVRSELRPAVDSSLAYSEFAKAKILLLDSKRNQQSRAYQLMELLGMDENQRMITADSMLFYSETPLLRDSLMATSHPLLEMCQARIEYARLNGVVASRSFLPTVSLVAAGWARGSGISNATGDIRTDFQSGIDYQVSNYLLGVTAQWRISDLVSSRTQTKKWKYSTERQTELYNGQKLMLDRQLRDATAQYQVMQEQVRTAPIQLGAAQSAYNQAMARFENGLSDLPTLLQSVVALNRAEADLAIAYSNLWRSRLMVAAAKGDLSLFTDQINH